MRFGHGARIWPADAGDNSSASKPSSTGVPSTVYSRRTPPTSTTTARWPSASMVHWAPVLAPTTLVMAGTLSVRLLAGVDRRSITQQGRERRGQGDRQPGRREAAARPGRGDAGDIGGRAGPHVAEARPAGHHHGEDALQPSAHPVRGEDLQHRLPVD